MVTEEADELLTPEALRVLCPSPEAERNQALGEALEAAYQCALISSYGKEPGPRGIWTVQRCGEPEVLLSALDAARWLSDRVRERWRVLLMFVDRQEGGTWQNWVALLDKMEALAEHVAWHVA